MALIDAVTSILGKAIDAAPAVFQIINNNKLQELQRDVIKAQIAAIGRPVGLAQAPPTARASGLGNIIQQSVPGFNGQFRATGGAMAGGPFVTTQGLGLPSIDVPGVDFGPQGSAALFSPFIPTMAGARAQNFVAVNPISQKLTWFRPAGRPILWSSDVSAKKRVERIAKYARRGRR